MRTHQTSAGCVQEHSPRIARLAWLAFVPVLLLGASLFLTAPSRAHGGVYRGPGSTFPPGSAGPSGTPAGAPTPLSQPGNSGNCGFACDSDSWSVWWGFQRESYVRVKERSPRATVTGSDEFFLGRGEREVVEPRRMVPREVIDGQLIPALLRSVRQSASPDLTTAGLLALAKVGFATGTENTARLSSLQVHMHEVFGEHLQDGNQEISETAVLAFGIAGYRQAALLLVDIARGQPMRESLTKLGIGKVSGQSGALPSANMRTFAVYGLGLLGHETQKRELRSFVAQNLVQLFESDDSSTADLRAACVLSMGLVPLEAATDDDSPAAQRPGVARQGQVLWLIKQLHNQKLRPSVRAQIPAALAAIAQGASDPWRERGLRALLETVQRRPSEPVELREGCATAIGMLANRGSGATDVQARKILQDLIVAGPNQVRRFAWLALGQCASRVPVEASADAQGRQIQSEVREQLLKGLSRARTTTRPWLALALAQLERGRIARGMTHSSEVNAAIQTVLRKSSNPEEVGGLCIAAGLLGDIEAAPVVSQKMQTLRSDSLRGYACISLGLLGERSEVEAIQKVLQESIFRPALLRDAATGLSLLGDRGTVPYLTEQLGEAKGLARQAALASALGDLGDARGHAALLKLVENIRLQPGVRAFAAAALGRIADDRLLPWNQPFASLWNYGAPLQSLSAGNGRGLLDIL